MISYSETGSSEGTPQNPQERYSALERFMKEELLEIMDEGKLEKPQQIHIENYYSALKTALLTEATLQTGQELNTEHARALETYMAEIRMPGRDNVKLVFEQCQIRVLELGIIG